jgi:hypothetical protein
MVNSEGGGGTKEKGSRINVRVWRRRRCGVGDGGGLFSGTLNFVRLLSHHHHLIVVAKVSVFVRGPLRTLKII